jgi:hypothetical protein
MRVRVFSPAKHEVDIDIDPYTPTTLSVLKERLQEAIQLEPADHALFRRRRLIPHSDDSSLSTDLPEVTVVCVNTALYPEKSFPAADFSYSFDDVRFADHDLVDDFPCGESSDTPQRREANARLRAIIDDVSERMSDPLAHLMAPVEYNYQDIMSMGNSRRRRHVLHLPSTSEEELDEEEENSEEEDLDRIIETRDAFEENLSPESEEVLLRLMALGFDRNIVAPVMVQCQGDEDRVRAILQQIIDAMP